MGKSVEQMLAELPPERQNRIRARVKELIREELNVTSESESCRAMLHAPGEKSVRCGRNDGIEMIDGVWLCNTHKLETRAAASESACACSIAEATACIRDPNSRPSYCRLSRLPANVTVGAAFPDECARMVARAKEADRLADSETACAHEWEYSDYGPNCGTTCTKCGARRPEPRAAVSTTACKHEWRVMDDTGYTTCIWCNRRGPDAVQHICGLEGYNGMIDPPCPACEKYGQARAFPAEESEDKEDFTHGGHAYICECGDPSCTGCKT